MKPASILLCVACLCAADDWRGEGFLYLKHTPQAVMDPVPVRAVTLGEGFWSERPRSTWNSAFP